MGHEAPNPEDEWDDRYSELQGVACLWRCPMTLEFERIGKVLRQPPYQSVVG